MGLLTERRSTGITAAALLFAAIFAARATVGTLGDAISFLYVIPVVLVAISAGTRAGLLAGGLAFVLSSAGTLMLDQPVTAIGYVNRAVVYLFVGGLTGRFATTLRTLEMESARHFELSLDMVCIAGFDGRFKRINPAFERILGYREEELLARPFVEFIHPDDRERTEEEAAAIGAGDGTLQFRNRYFDKAGKVHWLEWCSTPLPDEELIYAVARDVTDRKELEDELERLSQHDSLTGLFNRHRFEQEVERQLAHTRRYGNGGALLLADLDRFKQINDELGHAAGDAALRVVADALRDNLRGTDTIGRGVAARLGGDEFGVLLPEVDDIGAQVVAERLVDAVAAAEPVLGDGRPQPLSVSIGIALFDEYGRPPAEDLLAAADRAMYTAKATGGGVAALAAADGDARPRPGVGLL